MERDRALLALMNRLKAERYHFVTVTPATHARVVARPLAGSPSLRDIFGWNRPFAEAQIEADILALMRDAGIVRTGHDGLRSTLRVASLGADLFLHSFYPTEQDDAVFFGPDSYRFVSFLSRRATALQPRRIVDLGAGSGAGGIAVARMAPGSEVTLIDSNPAALDLARVNARAAGAEVRLIEGMRLTEGADLVVANPPYMIDRAGRAYRDGGALHGGQVALAWVRDALAVLAPGGTMLLYTGAAFVDGKAPLLDAIGQACGHANALLEVEEIDPDVFGEELEEPGYAQVERIAAVGIVIRVASG